MQDILIVGAGVSGLTAGYHLSQKGMRVTVIEKEQSVGGLARSFYYGDFVFDVGPHRFHTDDADVLRFIKMILGKDVRVIPRESGVWFAGRYHDWPLRFSTVFKLPPAMSLRTARDLISKRARVGISFEDYILNMYGKTLYEEFFEIYTRKFLKHDPATIHSDWAKAGIDRAVIDRRVKMNTLFGVIKRAILPIPVATEFIYPARGGIDIFSKRMAEEIEKNGGRVLLGSSVSGIRAGKKEIEEVTCDTGEAFRPDLLIWTAPINILCQLMDIEEPALKYLSALLYNVMIEGEPPLGYQWCYYGQEEIVFNRISIPLNFSPATAPEGKTGINLEVTCMEGDRVWNDPGKLLDKVKEDMVKVGLVHGPGAILDVRVEKIINVYPIYELDYLSPVTRILNHLSYMHNILLLGRTGTFWYNNMDHSIRAGMDCAEDVIRSERGGLRAMYKRHDFFNS
ncbi:MAG: FAD-dependent oxidoreductase [Candidatus Tritonobacter lacicola]|nr:FAD-dependent oxidoreductase [Candidatus Tritonobacter lacicola]